MKFIRKVLNICWSFHKSVVQNNLKYQNIHKGQTCMIFGNGSSLKYYDLAVIDKKIFLSDVPIHLQIKECLD